MQQTTIGINVSKHILTELERDLSNMHFKKVPRAILKVQLNIRIITKGKYQSEAGKRRAIKEMLKGLRKLKKLYPLVTKNLIITR